MGKVAWFDEVGRYYMTQYSNIVGAQEHFTKQQADILEALMDVLTKNLTGYEVKAKPDRSKIEDEEKFSVSLNGKYFSRAIRKHPKWQDDAAGIWCGFADLTPFGKVGYGFALECWFHAKKHYFPDGRLPKELLGEVENASDLPLRWESPYSYFTIKAIGCEEDGFTIDNISELVATAPVIFEAADDFVLKSGLAYDGEDGDESDG